MTQSPPDRGRRRLLGRARNTAVGAAALAVFGPTTAVQQPVAAAPAQPQESPRGYHETEHTRRYYQLARF